MFQACHDYVELAQSQGKRWQKMLQYEHEQRLRLEEMVEQLAKQHSSLEKQARKTFAHGNPNAHTDNNQISEFKVFIVVYFNMAWRNYSYTYV